MLNETRVREIVRSLQDADFQQLQHIRTQLVTLVAERKGVPGISLPIQAAWAAMDNADSVIATYVPTQVSDGEK